MNEWLQMLLPYLVQIAAVVALAAVTYGVKAAKSYLDQKLGHEKVRHLAQEAEKLVLWAEQTMKNTPGFEKKEVVMVGLRALAEALGTFLSDVELDQLIEASVFKMNTEKWPAAESG